MSKTDDVEYAPESGPPRRRRRRRRVRSGPPRGFYLLPHLITTANLSFGFYAIVQAFAGRHDLSALGIILAGDLSALGIILAGVCDALDGRVARFARTTSRFGVEYDSIADTVSFGVAPAMLAFSAGNLQVLGRPGWVMAFLFTVCAALRLARFNVSPARYLGRFEGMPSPAAAGVVATTQWFVSFLRENFKELDLRHSYGTLVIVVIALLFVIQVPSVTLFTISIAYVVAGPIEWLWRRYTGQALEELVPPEVLSDQESPRIPL
jgi:CDP-diacylglycerol--serine O-phosphatidyltransferase